MSTFNYKYIYLLGIGGIGMSALARYFKNIGVYVYGYDKTSTSLTKKLENEEIHIHYNDNTNLIPEIYKNPDNKNQILVIYTPAIPKNNSEFNFFLKNNYTVYKRAEILGEIVNANKGIAIAGTHGKTSVSTMIAQILKYSDLDCNAFLGGISKNFKTNFLSSSKSKFVIAEADEFDRSFLNLFPHYGVITSIDADHLDIYQNKNAIIESFQKFVHNIKTGGTLIIKQGIDLKSSNINKLTYSIDKTADYKADNIRIHNRHYIYDVITPEKTIKNIYLGISGLFNVENSIAAISIADQLNIHESIIKKALKEFEGIERRFDYQINDKIIYIDDYAHHPEEIKACVLSTRHLFKNKKIIGIFQPHLYSRTRDFVDEFAKSLELLDELILLEIYPARELPIEGITSKVIFDKVNIPNKIICDFSTLLEELQKKDIEVLLSMGAGDIDTLIEDITNLLIKKYNINKD